MMLQFAAVIACLVFSAFFSASEMSLSSANRLRLVSGAEAGQPGAKLAIRLLDRFDDVLSAILIGNNFVNIAMSSLASVIVLTLLGEAYAWLATAAVTVAVIIFGETIPKIVAKKNANRLLPSFAPLLSFLSVILKPVTAVTVFLVKLITGPFKGEENQDQDAAVEELQSIIETAEDEAVLDEDRSELLQAALDFDDISVSEVMTARVDIEAVDIADSREEIYEALCASTSTRVPVYEDSIDNVIGVLHLNRYFRALMNRKRTSVNIRPMLMKPCFVYKSTKLPAVLDQLRQARQHLAVVTDEYGGVCGIVTMEDVLEQIVGEIWDETDEIEHEVEQRPDGSLELDGNMTVGDFTELLDLDEDEFDTESSTVGGWVLEQFGAFPKAGDSVRWRDWEVTVLAMDGLRVDRLLLKRMEE